MPEVTFSIGGRVYRMGCDEGQEQELAELAGDIDRRVTAFKSSFGEVGDMRLMLMAAMEIGDELGDARQKLGALESEIEELRGTRSVVMGKVAAAQDSVAEMLDQAAERIERIATLLNGPDPETPEETGKPAEAKTENGPAGET